MVRSYRKAAELLQSPCRVCHVMSFVQAKLEALDRLGDRKHLLHHVVHVPAVQQQLLIARL